jgi:hypothetical protein
MRDPIRLRDSASGAGDGVRELLQGARVTRRMTDIERARIIAQGAKIAAVPAGGLLASPALVGAGKIIVGVVVLVAGAKALPSSNESIKTSARRAFDPSVEIVVPAITSASSISEAPVSTRIVNVHESTAASSLSVPRKAPIHKPIVRHEKPMVSAIAVEQPAPADGDELAREARQLAEAGALVATNPMQAIEQLEMHRATFPRGKLGIEREVLVIDALMRAGRMQEARERGATLLLKSNGSMYEARVRRMLETKKP